MALRYIDGTDKKNIYNLLCNLSSKNDSILLNTIVEERESLETDKNRTISSIANIKNKLSYEEENLRILNGGLSQAIAFFQSYDSNIDLQKYFGLLDIRSDFLDQAKRAVEEEQDSSKLSKNASSVIEELDDEVTKLSDDLKELDELLEKNQEMYNNTIVTTEELYYLIDGAVGGNKSFNKDYVEGLLGPLQKIAATYDIIFPDDFLDEASKAIFFPDDGFGDRVIEYSNGIAKEIVFTEKEDKKSVIQPIEEVNDSENELETIDYSAIDAEEEVPLEETQKEIQEEPVLETDFVESIPVQEESTEGSINIENGSIQGLEDQLQEGINVEGLDLISDEVSEESAPVLEEQPPISEEINVEDFANNAVVNENETIDNTADAYSLDESRCSLELLELLKNADSSLVKKNMEELEILSLEDQYYYCNGGYSYLTDSELSSKLNLLRGKRVSDAAIANAIVCHYLDNSLSDLEDKIKKIEENGEFDKSYLPLLKYDVTKYFEAISNLNEYSIEPDDKEKSQYLLLLANSSNNIIGDTEVLKEYETSLLRKNGKYELGLYSKTPLELQKALDDIIETGEEDLIASFPEVLKDDPEYIVRIIKYAQDNGIVYKDEGTYAEFIHKPLLFKKQFPDAELDELEPVNTSNEMLATMLNSEYCSLLINILTKYYESENSYKQISLTEEERIDCDRLKAMFREEMGAELVGKSTYKINDIFVSRNKFERNLNFLVSGLKSKGQDVIAMGKEIVTVCALFGSRKSKTKNIVLPEAMSNGDVSMGGMAA